MEKQSPTTQAINAEGPLRTIILAGLLAGTLDLTTAMVVYQIPPILMGKYIASGAVGPEALAGGTAMVILGLLIHYFIAFFWTIFFFLIYPKIPILSRNKIITGLLYGVFVWIMMNIIVLPFVSKITPRPFDFTRALTGATILMFMIGLPISILVNKYYSRK